MGKARLPKGNPNPENRNNPCCDCNPILKWARQDCLKETPTLKLGITPVVTVTQVCILLTFAERLVCHLKMLYTSYWTCKYSRCYICQVNPIQCYHRTNMTPLIISLRTIEWNVAYGCHTDIAKYNLLIFTRGGDCLTSGQSWKSVMRFIASNCHINIIHKYLMGLMRFIALLYIRFGSITGFWAYL